MSNVTGQPTRETLVRLANSRERAAAGNVPVGTRFSDLDSEDFKIIARVLLRQVQND